MLVDIRKYSMDNWINELVDASELKKNWLGKTKDNYWEYLAKSTTLVNVEINAHIFSDLLTFLIEELKFVEVLKEYSDKLSLNRNSSAFIFGSDDKQSLLNEINKSVFFLDFEVFCKDLNGTFYDYQMDQIHQTVNNFKTALAEIDENHCLIINVG